MTTNIHGTWWWPHLAETCSLTQKTNTYNQWNSECVKVTVIIIIIIKNLQNNTPGCCTTEFSSLSFCFLSFLFSFCVYFYSFLKWPVKQQHKIPSIELSPLAINNRFTCVSSKFDNILCCTIASIRNQGSDEVSCRMIMSRWLSGKEIYS
jgi:hypothetical protein